MIGGNTTATIQTRSTTKDEIGATKETWTDAQSITGWLDYTSGQTNYSNYDAKVQETTHIFISDYVALDSSISAENSRMVVNGKVYDILMIDNPMELNKQWEFYLKYTGGQ